MRAVVITQPGEPDVLTVQDRPTREPGPQEVRVRVRAAAVNPTDVGMRQSGGGDTPKPWTPGMDAAGTIESVGDGVDRLQVGDEVMAAVTPRRPEGGAQQELLVVAAASVVAIPDGATLEQAATLPMNGLTAQLGLDHLDLRDGGTLAVTGGAGLLASYVIALARLRGLTVIADAKPEDEALVAGYGADTIVPRGDDFAQAVRTVAPDGVDGLFDTALLTDRAIGAVKDGGTMTVVRGWSRGEPERGVQVRPTMVAQALDRTDWLLELRELVQDGRIRLRVAATFAPEQAADAQRLMDAGGLRGRAVIVF